MTPCWCVAPLFASQPANGDDDGTTTATPSSLPPINLTVTFDQGNHVNLEAVPGGREV